jgi:hypothetical protein
MADFFCEKLNSCICIFLTQRKINYAVGLRVAKMESTQLN